MTEQSEIKINVGKMGDVWIAAIKDMNISSVGDSRVEAIKGVLDALETHLIVSDN